MRSNFFFLQRKDSNYSLTTFNKSIKDGDEKQVPMDCMYFAKVASFGGAGGLSEWPLQESWATL